MAGIDGKPSHIHIERNEPPPWFKWLARLALLLGLLALIIALSRCDRDEATTAPAPAPTGDVVATTPNAPAATALAGTSGLGGYLAGTDPTPRTFTFEKLNFDSAKSEVRPADAAEVDQIATTLKRYPNARIRIAGYADARGGDAANKALGKARADAIRAKLVGSGVGADRIETVSGGEDDPVADNATTSGRFENRRTELVVTSR